MNTHEKINELLAGFALAELSEQQSSEVKKHLDDCQQCRSELKRLEAVLECAASMGELSADEQVCESAKQALLSALADEQKKQPTPRPNIRLEFIWRIIMKSRISKMAAAAAIIIALLIGIHQLGGSTPAFAEVVQSLLNIQTATFKMSMEVEGVPPQKFDCMYAEPVRMRQTNHEQGAIVISDFQQGKIVTLMPAQNKAMIVEMENVPEDEGKFNMFREIRKHLQEAQDTEDESVQFLGEKEIDGLTVIGYHVQKPGVDITVWADPQTKLPVEMTNTSGPTTYTMTDIVFDVELDESIFSLEIPEGYTIRTMQVDASKPTEKDLIEMFHIWAEHMDGNLPSVLDMNATMEFVKYKQKKMKDKGQEPSEESVLELQKTIMRMGRGAVFVQQLPAESDWHYTGKDAKFGDAETAIFWYQPEDSETYRVIYGDLSVKDVASENLPE